MAKTYLSQWLSIAKELETAMTGVFMTLHRDISADILRMTAGDVVPRSRLLDLQIAASRRVQRVFVGRLSDSEVAPFAFRDDRVAIPLAPYPAALWRAIEAAVALPVDQHADMMEKYLSPRAVEMLKMAPVAEQNPLVTYDAPHTWVDPNGYRLSDRIWNTSAATRRHIDAMLEDGVRRGQSSLSMSRDLETFLHPHRTLRTNRPYGTSASYDAMRLARTETSRAHANASEIAALQNPFVSGISVVLSGSHPRYDICDVAAEASPFPKDDIPFRYRIPLHPHCLCHYAYELVEEPAEEATRIELELIEGRSPLSRTISPILRNAFRNLLLSGGIADVIARLRP